MHKVFVYGTLRQGFGNNILMKGTQPTWRGRTAERYRMYSLGGFPAVTTCSASTPIVGEMYEVDDSIMESLDCLEGYPSFYNRMQVELENKETAWMYYIEEPDTRWTEVEDGDWARYQGRS